MKEVPVLIAGGGPVGMTLACELALRDIACMLVERNATTTRHPKMDITNARRVMDRFMTHFRSQATDVLQRWGVAWHYQSPAGSLIAQNDRDTWTLQTRWPSEVAPDKVDPRVLLRAFAGRDFDHEILVANAWTPHLLVAQQYGTGRVFLAGDAAHQYIPTGGYGMNTGIADACDLGWKLAAVLHGFGGPRLLASYDLERRPVGMRNREASRRHSEVRAEIAVVYRTCLPSGLNDEAARTEAGRRIAKIGNAENESFGIELGYAYADSPVICADPGAQISKDPLRYVPTTAPGVRLPSIVLPDGVPIFDSLGRWFTLVCVGVFPGDALKAAAARRGIPLDVLKLDAAEAAKAYGRGLLVVRPDQHIAWRGGACDDLRAADAVMSRVLGLDAPS